MPNVTVEGPISGGAHGWPFGAAVRDLAAEGYVEEEYFFTGDAYRYRPVGPFGVDGRWPAERAGTDRFVTRAVVRRPADPARFNGTVLVEWNNVSSGLEIFEAGDTSVVFDEGFAYVGVSVQIIGLIGFAPDPHGLHAWDPQRYGALHLPDDALSYGVFTEVARAVGPQRSGPVDPLAALPVAKVVALGGSQSAGRLATYVNAVQPIERVFDALMLFTWFGSGTTLDDPTTLTPASRHLYESLHTKCRLRDDLGVPVMVVNAECETLSMYPVRQPDTDTFRAWEVAGAPHGPRLHMERIFAKLMRDQVAITPPPEAPPMDPATFGPVAWAPVFDAALGHMQRWINGGAPPPSQPLIEVAGEPPQVVRDSDGNALGGVRLPEQEATLSRNIGALEESGAATLMGISSPLPPATVAARYPDRAAYVAAFSAAADRAVAVGVLRPRDAAESIARATAAWPG
ncbi:MAG: alpha/beta hydrolase domain-containing protein [Acidimicrobiia bacterium]